MVPCAIHDSGRVMGLKILTKAGGEGEAGIDHQREVIDTEKSK